MGEIVIILMNFAVFEVLSAYAALSYHVVPYRVFQQKMPHVEFNKCYQNSWRISSI